MCIRCEQRCYGWFTFSVLTTQWFLAASCFSSSCVSPLDDFQNSIVPALCAPQTLSSGWWYECEPKTYPELCYVSKTIHKWGFLPLREAGGSNLASVFEKTPERKCQLVTGRVKTKRICIFQRNEWQKWDVSNQTANQQFSGSQVTVCHRKCDDSAHKIFLLFFSLVADMAQKRKDHKSKSNTVKQKEEAWSYINIEHIGRVTSHYYKVWSRNKINNITRTQQPPYYPFRSQYFLGLWVCQSGVGSVGADKGALCNIQNKTNKDKKLNRKLFASDKGFQIRVVI